MVPFRSVVEGNPEPLLISPNFALCNFYGTRTLRVRCGPTILEFRDQADASLGPPAGFSSNWAFNPYRIPCELEGELLGSTFRVRDVLEVENLLVAHLPYLERQQAWVQASNQRQLLGDPFVTFPGFKANWGTQGSSLKNEQYTQGRTSHDVAGSLFIPLLQPYTFGPQVLQRYRRDVIWEYAHTQAGIHWGRVAQKGHLVGIELPAHPSFPPQVQLSLTYRSINPSSRVLTNVTLLGSRPRGQLPELQTLFVEPEHPLLPRNPVGDIVGEAIQL